MPDNSVPAFESMPTSSRPDSKKDKMSPNPDTPLELTGSIWFASDSQNWGSQRRMALLRAIDEEGSISAGAKKIGLSYKAAWDAVDLMNNLAGEPLVERTTGGQRGGGTRLTSRAKNIVTLYQTVSEAHERFVAQLSSLAGQSAPDLDLIRHLMVQTSARNKLAGTVQNIVPGAASDEVAVNLGAGTEIIASISRSSVDELDLDPGRHVLVFIDATAVIIGVSKSGSQLSARNQLEGTIERIAVENASAEISIRLAGGQTLVSQITPESVENLSLKEGQSVYAIFKAPAVMLGMAS